MNPHRKSTKNKRYFDRSLIFKGGLFLVGAIIVGQLFFVQIVKHDYYSAAALAEHTKKFEIPAERGTISVSNGYGTTPIVLNETKYMVYADPKYIQDSSESARQLQEIIGGKQEEIQTQLIKDTRYVVLAKKVDKGQSERIEKLKIKGVGLKEISVRSYPQGSVAAHVLGFVNYDGKGQYGVEEYLNSELDGESGMQKVITDVNGIPLAINNDGAQTEPKPGDDVTLTIDLRLQQIVEDKLKANVERTQSTKGSAVLIDPNTGEIKAMANYPTFDPGLYTTVEDQSIFTNTAITSAWEPGSIMKPLLMSTAFNEGTANRGSTYFDNGSVTVGDATMSNSKNWGARVMSMDDVLTKSLNVGAVHILSTLGGGEINEKARTSWHDYLTDHYMFNKQTGVQLAAERPGGISGPNEGYGLNVRYANMAFGQGMTVTPLQVVAAYSALVNGGTYYKPSIISEVKSGDVVTKNQPTVIKDDVIRDDVSAEVKDIMRKVVDSSNPAAKRDGYVLGAKSGTAQLAAGDGSYKEDSYNGTYIGYVEGKKLEYVLLVRLDEPKTSGFASTQAAITWAEITNEIINSIAIEPKN